MKAKEFISKVAAIVGLNNNEVLTKALEKAELDVELGDDIGTEFDKKLLTRERAENDKEILDKIQKKTRSEVFDKVDGHLKPILAHLEKEDADDINATFQTYEKLEKAEKALKKKLDKAKSEGATADVKALQDKLTQLEREHHAQLQQKENEKKAAIDDVTGKLQNANLDFVLKGKIFANEFAKEWAGDKESIAATKIEKLKKEHILALDTDGTIKVQYKDNDGTLREKFEGNEKLTIDKILKTELALFTKKNNGGNGGGSGGDGGKPRETVEIKPGMTLAEQRAAMRTQTRKTS